MEGLAGEQLVEAWLGGAEAADDLLEDLRVLANERIVEDPEVSAVKLYEGIIDQITFIAKG